MLNKMEREWPSGREELRETIRLAFAGNMIFVNDGDRGLIGLFINWMHLPDGIGMPIDNILLTNQALAMLRYMRFNHIGFIIRRRDEGDTIYYPRELWGMLQTKLGEIEWPRK
jgi:hypothetical protein